MARLFALIIVAILMACAGLQNAPNVAYNLTHAPIDTAIAEATSGTKNAYAMTQDAWNITQTAYIASFPTLSVEQAQSIHQTQDVLMEQSFARETYDANWRETSIAIITADAESIAQGTDPIVLTGTSGAATRSMYTPDFSFAYTATSFIQTATAQHGTPYAYRSPTPCPYEYAWTSVVFRYDNGLNTPVIFESTHGHCSSDFYMLFSHEIVINDYAGINYEVVPAILEDAVSRLRDYPPHQSEASEMIRVTNSGKGYWNLGIFTYTDALAAYESGLRGADLAEALGVRMP